MGFDGGAPDLVARGLPRTGPLARTCPVRHPGLWQKCGDAPTFCGLRYEPMLDLSRYPLERLAATAGTPFYLYDGDALRAAASRFAEALAGKGVAGRYAMKANSNRKVLEVMRGAGMWID